MVPVTEHGGVIEKASVVNPFVRGSKIAIPANQILDPIGFIFAAIGSARIEDGLNNKTVGAR